MACDQQRRDIEESQGERAPGERPAAVQQPLTPVAADAPYQRLVGAVAPPLQVERAQHEETDGGKLDREARRPAKRVGDRECGEPGLIEPPGQVRRADHRARDEGAKRDRHAKAAGAGAAEGAGSAAAAELHADAEQEGPERNGDSDGRQRAAEPLAERAAAGEQRCERDACCGDHQELRPDARAAAVHEKPAGGRGEAEERVVEREPCQAAYDQQRRQAAVHRDRERDDAGRDQRPRHSHDRNLRSC